MASWRQIFFLLSMVGLLSTVAVVGMLFWMTATIEDIEREKTLALINLKVSKTSESLRLAVEDYAYWTLAFDLVEERDAGGVFEHLGSGATESALFDQLFILSPEGDLLYAFDEYLGAGGHSLFEESVFRPIWQALNETRPKDYQSVTTILEHQGGYSFVTAAWITPDAISRVPDTPVPALFGVIHLGAERLQELVTDAQISTATIMKYEPESLPDRTDEKVAIYGLDDQPVAILAWRMRSVGETLRRELLPIVVMVTLLIVTICGMAARYFRAQFIALTQANIVATTDQLTGLLNRAGLAEVLKTKTFSQSLEKGQLAVIYLDLNKFKDLNDTLGHEAGDIALRVTAERLNSAVRKSDIVARLGGDEFVCIVIDAEPEKAAVSIAQRILDLASAAVSFGDHEQVITPSAGVAVSTSGTQWDTVLSQSDVAMYWAKQRHADYPVVFCKSMDTGKSL